MKYIKNYYDSEKEWMKYFKILSFKYKIYDDWKIINPDHPEFNGCIEDCIENSYTDELVRIFSVERISDGEVFTLGEKVCSVGFGKSSTTYGSIDRIWPSFDQMRCDVGNMGMVLNNDFIRSVRSGLHGN